MWPTLTSCTVTDGAGAEARSLADATAFARTELAPPAFAGRALAVDFRAGAFFVASPRFGAPFLAAPLLALGFLVPVGPLLRSPITEPYASSGARVGSARWAASW